MWISLHAICHIRSLAYGPIPAGILRESDVPRGAVRCVRVAVGDQPGELLAQVAKLSNAGVNQAQLGCCEIKSGATGVTRRGGSGTSFSRSSNESTRCLA